MADHYTHANSFIGAVTPECADALILLVQRMKLWYEVDLPSVPDKDGNLVLCEHTMQEQLTRMGLLEDDDERKGMIAALKLIYELKFHNEMSLGFDIIRLRDGERHLLYVVSDGGVFDMEKAASFLHHAMSNLGLDVPNIGIEASFTSSRSEAGSFGGAACFITKQGISWLTTQEWITQQMRFEQWRNTEEATAITPVIQNVTAHLQGTPRSSTPEAFPLHSFEFEDALEEGDTKQLYVSYEILSRYLDKAALQTIIREQLAAHPHSRLKSEYE